MDFNHRGLVLGHNCPSLYPNPSTQCTYCFHSTQHTHESRPLWPRYFCLSCPSCLPGAMPILVNPHAQVFTCTATPTPTKPWLIHRASTPPYRLGLNAHAAPFTPGMDRHVTNFEHLRKIAGEIQTIELNIELGNRNVELERLVREMDAQLRGVEDCRMLDGGGGAAPEGVYLVSAGGHEREEVCVWDDL